MANTGLRIRANDPMLIAPCGLNCSLCRAYIRGRNPCPGCRGGDNHKSKTCSSCTIKNCKNLTADKHQFCYSCAKFPCAPLLHLASRYQDKYGVSIMANLERINAVGAENFVAEETAKWACPNCNSLLCMHKPQCINRCHTRQDR